MIFALFFCGCGDQEATVVEGDTPRLHQVTLALNWYAEAEHGGYIAGRDEGFFENHGVQVDVRPGSVGAPNLVIQELAAGKIEFAVSNADLVVLARSKGVPIVAVAAPLQMSPRCIMVHDSSGFQSLEDLENIELSISDTRPFALWMKKKLPLKNVTMVPFSGSVGEFLRKEAFAQQGYVFSEPFVAKEKGGDPKVLMLSDIGFNPYSSLLVTTEELIRTRPEVVKSVVEGSVAGWESYLSSPAKVNAAIHAENNDMSLEALKYGAETMSPLCTPADGDPFCGMTLDRWTALVSQIEELGEIEKDAVKPQDCFDISFLPKM